MYEEIINKEKKIAVVGLGYVGLPLAVEFAKYANVIGFDLNKEKIQKYKNGIDVTQEVGDEAIKNTTCEFTDDETKINEASFIIVAVPTPISLDKSPDLYPVESASETVGRNLKKGSIVVYESTVYPGVTEDICVPILEKNSKLKCGEEFKIGYSPERINPGDKNHRLYNIKKIVSGMDEESLEEIAKIYNIVIKVGVFKAKTIKVAEAAKVIENSQRDVNIAFVNEIAMALDRMGIDTKSVLEAMDTKWNALGFRPGLVGGHCIGVDPYYFIYEAEKLGFHSQIISAARRINDDLPQFIVSNIVKQMILAGKKIKGSKILVLGITFKENCKDIRNSKVVDIIRGLYEYGADVIVTDPYADVEETKKEYDIDIVDLASVDKVDTVVLAVAHNEYKELTEEYLKEIQNDEPVIIDIKSIKDAEKLKNTKYWRL